MFSHALFPVLVALSAISSLTMAIPLESHSLTKRDGAMFTLTVNDVENSMPGYNNAPIQARNSGFYIGGGGPATTCPPTGPCPSTNQTVFQCVADNTNTTCYLATQSGKQPIYFETNGALKYAPSYMYGHLTPADSPFFRHTGDQFQASQFFDTKKSGSFMNENWYGCSSSNTLNPQYAVPYQLFFALTGGSGCGNPTAWIEVTATPVDAATAYAYAQ